MTQVYAVLHTADGQVLLAFKNERNYFFIDNQGLGRVVRHGEPIISGPGLAALPGGGKKPDEGIEAAALREFHEETGVDLGQVPSQKWTIMGDANYYAVCFQVDKNDFYSIAVRIISVNLMAGHTAVDLVKGDQPVTYQQLMELRPKPPDSNELRSADVVQILTPEGWARVTAETDRPGIRWYYFILSELREKLKRDRV